MFSYKTYLLYDQKEVIRNFKSLGYMVIQIKMLNY
jgi:hypothetical protein